jgi:hypothetical protein
LTDHAGRASIAHVVQPPRQIYASTADRRHGRRWSRVGVADRRHGRRWTRRQRSHWLPAAVVALALVIAGEALRSLA